MSRKKARLTSDSARTNSPPILKLEDIKLLASGNNAETNYFHLNGIFVCEESDSNGYYWCLTDETCSGAKIKLCKSNNEEYPVTKPGDFVRIHRARLDRGDYMNHVPFVGSSKNVVVWSAFEHDPIPRTAAKSPTITEEDRERQRTLETFYCSQITDLGCIRRSTLASTKFFNVAGVVEKIEEDTFGHLRITFRDATDSFIIRIFQANQSGRDINDHFEVARKLEVGQYIIAANTKLDKNRGSLDLSANKSHGKSIRVVDRASILGMMLTQSLNNNLVGTNNIVAAMQHDDSSQQQVEHTQSQILTTIQTNVPNRPLRRSPRFQNQQIDQATDPLPPVITAPEPQLPEEPPAPQERQGLQHELRLDFEEDNPTDPMYNYVKLSEIKETPGNQRLFCDIAGQVRGNPCEADGYYRGHWLIQIYDGSRPRYESYYVQKVAAPQPDCITLLVFSPREPKDTNQHIENAKSLKEGDLILVRNVSIVWTMGKMKLGLSANLEHGKSIIKIDENSRFGRHLAEITNLPFIEDLLEAQKNSTPLECEIDSSSGSDYFDEF